MKLVLFKETRDSIWQQKGASVAKSGAEPARNCDVMVLCLPRSADVHRVVFGGDGVTEGLVSVSWRSIKPRNSRETREPRGYLPNAWLMLRVASSKQVLIRWAVMPTSVKYRS